MEYEELIADFLPNQALEFTCVEENEEEMQRLGVDQRMRQLGTGKWRSHLATRSINGVELFSDRFNKAFTMRLEAPANMVAFVFCVNANGQLLADGENVANDKLLVLPPGKGVDIVSRDLGGSESFLVPEQEFIRTTEALLPSLVQPERASIIEGKSIQLHALRKTISKLATDRGSMSNDGEASALATRTIMLMGDLLHIQPEGLTSIRARAQVAMRARDFIEARFRTSIRIVELCRETGVGERTLQRCFKERFNLTFTDYLKTVRLDEAYRTLRASGSSDARVTATALRNGFTHMGRFSVEFRKRFGISPKALLDDSSRRSSDQGH